MNFTYDPLCDPLYRLPPYESAWEAILPPKQAASLTEPLKEKVFLVAPCAPKPYRIMTNISHISAYFHNNAAIDKEGVLWRWGAESIAQDMETGIISEDLSQNVNYIPRRQMEHITSVSAGPWHMMCIKEDGSLWGWGQNEYGQLGLGDCLPRTEPTPIMRDVAFVCTGEALTLAIKKDNSLWGWGSNTMVFPQRYSYRPVHLMDHVIRVSAGDRTVLIIKEDHTLWGWGRGIKKYDSFQEPTMLMENVKTTATDPRDTCFSMVVTLNGDLYSLGLSCAGSIVKYYERSKLGDGPVKVLDQVDDVVVGHNLTFIRTKDNRLFASGDNFLGQCGTGKSTGAIYKPVFVMDHVSEIAAGYYHGMALRENGDVWIWGGDYSTPIKRRKPQTKSPPETS